MKTGSKPNACGVLDSSSVTQNWHWGVIFGRRNQNGRVSTASSALSILFCLLLICHVVSKHFGTIFSFEAHFCSLQAPRNPHEVLLAALPRWSFHRRQGEMTKFTLGPTFNQYPGQSSAVVGRLASSIPGCWDILLPWIFYYACVCVCV